MKNLRFTIIFIVILFGTNGFGQEIKVTPEIALRSTTSYDVIGTIQDVTMVLLKDNDRYKVKAFDETMNRKWERSLKFEKKNAKIVGFIPSRKSLTLFYKYKQKGHLYLRMRKYNEDLKMVDSTLIKWYPRRSFSPKPKMYHSQNKNKVLFLSEHDDKSMDVLVFDRKKKKLVEDTKIAPNDFSYKKDFLDALVDNKGRVHFVMEKDNKKSKKDENRLEFISLLGGNNVKYYSVDLESNPWYDLETNYDNINEKLLISGLYSHKTSIEAHGIFYINVDPNNTNNKVVKFSAFENDFLTLVLGKEIKKNVGLNEITVQRIIPRSDGGVLMIAERNKKYIRNLTNYSASSYGRGHTPVQTDYYFNEILLFSFNPDGTLHWKEILHKKQFSQDDNGDFSSFFLFFTRSNLRLIYNDAIKRTGTVYEYVVNGNGESDRASLFNTKPYKSMLKMREAIQVSSNTLIVPSERRSSLRLVRLTF